MHDGDDLYGLVRSYADMGDHRTGTEADVETVVWLSALLEGMGARVTRQSWGFSRYSADWAIEVDDEQIESLPLFYSQTGSFDTLSPIVRALPLEADVVATGLEDMVAALPRDRPIVLATQGVGGRLIAQNRDPEKPTAAPVLLAAGRDLERLQTGRVRARLHASINAGQSANVVAAFGGESETPYVVTTPLTGWFRCAGERGTGIAVALAAAAALAAHHPVLFVATGGHELNHLGARVFRRRRLSPRAVLHLGASVAACDPAPATGELALAAQRLAFTSAAAGRHEIEAALAPAALHFAADPPPPWPGEGEEWRGAGAPLLSLLGRASTFHAPDDLPASATTPALLAQVAAAVIDAARLLPEASP